MTTEHRRGIPSVAHVEAAMRLGLEWHRQGCDDEHRTVFLARAGVVLSDYGLHPSQRDRTATISSVDAWERQHAYRPIRTDGTPVDWEVLDAEVARVAQPAGASPEPRSFADVRPDRHGWRWWRIIRASGYNGSNLEQSRFEVRDGTFRWSANDRNWTAMLIQYWADRTVIPTDEQGNPVSWESIAQGPVAPAEPAATVTPTAAPRPSPTITNTPQQLRVINLDDLTTLLRRHLGDTLTIVSVRKPRGVYRVQVDWGTPDRTIHITPRDLPHNVSIWRPSLGIDAFDLRGTDTSTTLEVSTASRSVSPQPPSYFAVDGDTVSTPNGAPPWLHQMCAEMCATASWRRVGSDSFSLIFDLAYGQKLEKSMTARAVRNISLPGFPTVSVTATNRPAPPVPVCMVAAMRRNQDLAALSPNDSIPGERDATVAWSQLDPATSQLCRNVVHEIVEHGCYGLDDAAAAARAGVYHQLIAEAIAAKVEMSSHVRAWCAQFQTRTALLEVDDGEVRGGEVTIATLRCGAKTPTPAVIAKFRDLMSSKLCPGRTEAAKQSGLDCEVTQHILLRWCGGLDDTVATEVVSAVWRSFGAAYNTHQPLTRIDEAVQAALPRPALDVSGAAAPDAAYLRARQAQEARRNDLAALQAQLRRERALRACADDASTLPPGRFALLEVDEAADPAASIARWKAGREAAAAAGRKSAPAAPVAAAWQPPATAPQRIDFDVPVRHDYVDVSDMPAEVQGVVVIGTLVDAARRALGVWEN